MLVVCALAGAGCGSGDAPTPAAHGRVVMPDLEGKTRRQATCELQRLGLRWRFRGSDGAESRPAAGCGDNHMGASGDDIPVTGQTPRPGARLRRGTVVTLDDICTDAAKSGGSRCVDARRGTSWAALLVT
jgi:hypothetical protein